MSTLYYNGVAIEVLKTVVCRRRVVLDGPTYLWSEWYIHVRGLLNPAATSYAGAGGAERPTLGRTPSLTDSTIRHLLAQPRQKLVFTAAPPDPTRPGLPDLNVLQGGGGSLVILDCPETTFAAGGVAPNFTGSADFDEYFTDAQNGPFPSIYNVVRIDGMRTFHVEFAVTARVNECYNYYSDPAVLLSHRWTESHDVDRDGFTRRSVRGHAVFRSDVLLNLGTHPDDYRAALFHPIARNCQRQNVRVTAHEDGCRLDYSFTDQEVSHYIIPTHVSRIEAFGTIHQTRPNTGDAASGFWKAAGALLRKSFSGAASALADGLLPFESGTIVIRVWGTRRASLILLVKVAEKVFLAKMPDIFAGGGPGVPYYGIDSDLTFDFVGKYVELRATVTVPLSKRIVLAATTLDADTTSFPHFADDDIDGVATTADSPGRMAVLGNETRGTMMQMVVAAALQNPCGATPAPGDQGLRTPPLPPPKGTPPPPPSGGVPMPGPGGPGTPPGQGNLDPPPGGPPGPGYGAIPGGPGNLGPVIGATPGLGYGVVTRP